MTSNRSNAFDTFDIDIEEDVRMSYESVRNVDVLDISHGEWHGRISADGRWL